VKSFHALRHTFVYMAAEAQVPLPIIVSIVGHASPRMTEHYAAHATLEAKKRLLTELSFHSVLSGIW
jgi:integrase